MPQSQALNPATARRVPVEVDRWFQRFDLEAELEINFAKINMFVYSGEPFVTACDAAFENFLILWADVRHAYEQGWSLFGLDWAGRWQEDELYFMNTIRRACIFGRKLSVPERLPEWEATVLALQGPDFTGLFQGLLARRIKPSIRSGGQYLIRVRGLANARRTQVIRFAQRQVAEGAGRKRAGLGAVALALDTGVFRAEAGTPGDMDAFIAEVEEAVARVLAQAAAPAGLEALEASIQRKNPLVGQALGLLASAFGEDYWQGWHPEATPRWSEVQRWRGAFAEVTRDQIAGAQPLPEGARTRLVELLLEAGFLYCRRHFVAWMNKNKRLCYRDGRRHPVHKGAPVLPVLARTGARCGFRTYRAEDLTPGQHRVYSGYLALLKRPRPWRLNLGQGPGRAVARLRLPRYRSPLNQTTISSLWFLYRSSLLAPDLAALLLDNDGIRQGTAEVSAVALTSPFYLLLEDYFHHLEGAPAARHFAPEYLDLIDAFMRRLFTEMLKHSPHATLIEGELTAKLGRPMAPVAGEMLDGLLTVPIWQRGRRGLDKASALEKFRRPIGQHQGAAAASDYNAQFEAHMAQSGVLQELEAIHADGRLAQGDHLRGADPVQERV